MLVGYVYGAISEEDLDRVIVKCEDDECTGHVFHGAVLHDSAVTNEFVGNRLSVESWLMYWLHFHWSIICYSSYARTCWSSRWVVIISKLAFGAEREPETWRIDSPRTVVRLSYQGGSVTGHFLCSNLSWIHSRKTAKMSIIARFRAMDITTETPRFSTMFIVSTLLLWLNLTQSSTVECLMIVHRITKYRGNSLVTWNKSQICTLQVLSLAV